MLHVNPANLKPLLLQSSPVAGDMHACEQAEAACWRFRALLLKLRTASRSLPLPGYASRTPLLPCRHASKHTVPG